MERYPKLLQQDFCMQFLFSPNFHYYLSLNYSKKNFYIKATEFAEDKDLKVLVPVNDMFT